MSTPNGLQERIREALRSDPQYSRGLADLQAAENQLRSLTKRYVAKHFPAPAESEHDDLAPDLEKTAVEKPLAIALTSAAERRLTAELATAVDESRALTARLRRSKRWLIALSMVLVIAAAGAGVLGYLLATRN
jgi:hypothetical protein